MVGIARPEDFTIFIRKIGYSVGLENTLVRFSDFCHLYAEAPQLKPSDWKRLVREKWSLKSEHVADVFHALRFVQVTAQGVHAGPIGEAGAICVKMARSDAERSAALAYLFGLAVLLADGDVFFNCLATEFASEALSKSLVGMVLGKREELFRVFKSQGEREAIAAAITIERQRGNKGGAAHKQGLQDRVGGGLSSGLKGLGLPKAKEVHTMDAPSADYLRHVIPARREWARSLNLCDKDGKVTERGWAWLKLLGDEGYVFESGEFSLRPTRFELEANRLSAVTELYARSPSTWDYVRLVAKALRGTGCRSVSSLESETLAAWTKGCFTHYRELSQDRRMVRNELPLLVASAAYVALASSSGEAYLDYDGWIRGEEALAEGLKVRSSRTIELGILLPTNGSD